MGRSGYHSQSYQAAAAVSAEKWEAPQFGGHDELVDKPGSVLDDHSSATNCHRSPEATYPNPPWVTVSDSYLVLLRTGFTIATLVANRAVRSYRTFSPLPAKQAVSFLLHFP